MTSCSPFRNGRRSPIPPNLVTFWPAPPTVRRSLRRAVEQSFESRPHRGNVRHEVAGWERTAANRVSGETDPLEHAVDRAPFVVDPGEPVGRASLDDDVDAVALAVFIRGEIGRAHV